jgi:hypothetical protein
MCNSEAELYALSYRLKSARQKKRARKGDLDKQLIQLDKLRTKLRHDKERLPWVPLAEPYQKGWKRFFVLREDIRRSKDADFYQTLLDKINTVHYSRDKAFRIRKRRMRRYIYTVETQAVREIQVWEWNGPKLKLTERERMHFFRYERWCPSGKYWKASYVFTEPWRFVLRIRPHMITEQRMINANLEAELQRLKNYIERNSLSGKIYKLTRSKRGPWNWHEGAKPQDKHPFINKPLRIILAECKEAETE